MSATKYALQSTEHEIADAYRNLGRVLTGGQKEYAMKAATSLVRQDATRLWNYLREYASVCISIEETTPLLLLDALSNYWAQDHNETFVSRAVLVLIRATKGNTAADEMRKYL